MYFNQDGWVITKNEITVLGIVTFLFLTWILTYGGFHFCRQAKVERNDYNSLLVKKGFSAKIITTQDIVQVKFYRIINYKMGNILYKIAINLQNNEIICFTYKVNNVEKCESIFYDEKKFYNDTNCFWGLVPFNRIKRSDRLFECK